MKYEKCIVGDLYFVVCFAKTFAKYLQSAKYDKCIASLTGNVVQKKKRLYTYFVSV